MTVGHCRYNTVCSVIACLVHRQCVCARGRDVCMCASWRPANGVDHATWSRARPVHERLTWVAETSDSAVSQRRSRAQWVTRHNVYLTEQPASQRLRDVALLCSSSSTSWSSSSAPPKTCHVFFLPFSALQSRLGNLHDVCFIKYSSLSDNLSFSSNPVDRRKIICDRANLSTSLTALSHPDSAMMSGAK